jgi:hypothetical protein
VRKITTKQLRSWEMKLKKLLPNSDKRMLKNKLIMKVMLPS